MDQSDKYNIFSLMCTDYWELGMELFKSNNLDIDEFIEYAIHHSSYSDFHNYNSQPNPTIYNKYINILGCMLNIDLSEDFDFPQGNVYINVLYGEPGRRRNIFHSKNGERLEDEAIDMLYYIKNKVKDIIYGERK